MANIDMCEHGWPGSGCRECFPLKDKKMRLDADTYFLEIAKLVAQRATCSRRQVGCVLVDEHNHILATGYNGVPMGMPHCIDEPCAGAGLPSGTGLTKCQAVHAEANALLQCSDVFKIDTVYCTASPCSICLPMLLNTGAKRIVFAEEYPHPESKEMWRKAGRLWVHHTVAKETTT